MSPTKSNITNVTVPFSATHLDISSTHLSSSMTSTHKVVTGSIDRTPIERKVAFLSQEDVEAGKLTQLMGLDMSQVGLYTLSLELFDLRSLNVLLLANNQLHTIPADISRLTHLHIIDLSGNRLSVLPKEFGLLFQLRELYLENNCLKTLPPQMGCLHVLQILTLERNPLEGHLYLLVNRQAGVQDIIMHLRNSMSK
jgi:Leucine-rich repeat (LRR) protein